MRAESLLANLGFTVVDAQRLERYDTTQKLVVVRHKTEAVMNRLIGRMVHGIGREDFERFARVPNMHLCIEEKSTGDILIKRMVDIYRSFIPCRCMFCRASPPDYARCMQQEGGMVYFPRDLFDDITSDEYSGPRQESFV